MRRKKARSARKEYETMTVFHFGKPLEVLTRNGYLDLLEDTFDEHGLDAAMGMIQSRGTGGFGPKTWYE